MHLVLTDAVIWSSVEHDASPDQALVLRILDSGLWYSEWPDSLSSFLCA